MMRLFFDNLTDYAATVLTAASQDPYLPVGNLANALRKKIYRTGSSIADEYVDFDLGSAKSVSSIIILDHNFDPLNDEIFVDASTDNFVSSDVVIADEILIANGTVVATWNAVSYRYWRFGINKASAGVTRDIGRVFLGTYYEVTEQPDYDGVKWASNDPSVSTFSAGGQQYTDLKEHFDSLDLSFSTSPGAQVYQFESIFSAVGISTPFFVQVEQAAAPFNKVFYCTFNKSFQRGVKAFDGSYFWDSTVSFREQI